MLGTSGEAARQRYGSGENGGSGRRRKPASTTRKRKRPQIRRFAERQQPASAREDRKRADHDCGTPYHAEASEPNRNGHRHTIDVPDCCRRRYESLKVMSWAHTGADGETRCSGDRSLKQSLENAPDPAAIPPAALLEGLPPEAEMFFSMQLRADWSNAERRRAWDLTHAWTSDDCRLFAERLGGRLPSRSRWPRAASGSRPASRPDPRDVPMTMPEPRTRSCAACGYRFRVSGAEVYCSGTCEARAVRALLLNPASGPQR